MTARDWRGFSALSFWVRDGRAGSPALFPLARSLAGSDTLAAGTASECFARKLVAPRFSASQAFAIVPEFSGFWVG